MTISIATTLPAASTPALRLPAVAAHAPSLQRPRAFRGSPDSAPVLIMAGVHKSFSAGVAGCSAATRVLVGASLRVAAGEVVGVAGGVGAGKSTLLLCAAGILQPELGSISWPGELAIVPGSDALAPLYLEARAGLPLRELERARAAGVRLVILDHAGPALLHDLRGATGRSLQSHGAALIVASRDRGQLARVASRVVIVRDGILYATASVAGRPADPTTAQRKRSAARASSELPSALARARMRSTCGRSFRSPQ